MRKIIKSPHLNKRVKTPYGYGEIIEIEEFKNIRRYGIKLDQNPFSFPVAYFPTYECEI